MLHIKCIGYSDDKAFLKTWADQGTIAFLKHDLQTRRVFLVAYHGSCPAGVASLAMDSHRVPGAIGVSFIAVDQAFKGQGVGRFLVEAVFDLAEASGKALANTEYTAEGQLKLKPLFSRLQADYPHVAVHEWPTHAFSSTPEAA